MIEDYPTKSEAQEQAREYAEPLDRLINPDDVDADAEEWNEVDEEKLERECWQSAEVVSSEHREIRNLVQDTAFRLWVDDLKRLPRDVLADASDDELVHVYGIWPNDMDKWDLYKVAHRVFEKPNTGIPQGYVNDALEVVRRGLFEGTKPE